MVALAVLVVVLLPLPSEGWVHTVNLAVWAIFAVDYFARLALSTDRKAFLRRNIVDLLAIMPAEFFRGLRVLRVARLFRLVRAGSVMARVLRDVRGVAHTNGLNWVLIVSLGTVLAGATVVWVVEPGIGSFADAVWWSTVTATTVGYGDLAPQNGLARVVAIVLMLVGIGTIGMLTGSIATYFLGDDDGAADPDIEHIRERLRSWSSLSEAERRRVVAMLSAAIDEPAV